MDRPDGALRQRPGIRAEAAEIVRSLYKLAEITDDFPVQTRIKVPGAVVKMRGENRGIPERVAVDFSSGREPRMKTRRGSGCLEDAELWRKRGIQRHHPSVHFPHSAEGTHTILRNFKMSSLSKGVNTGVGPPRAVDGGSLAEDPPNGRFQCVLHGASHTLALPSAERGAIVGDKQADFHRVYANDRESSQS